mmetsp:Transcript_1331/g.2901  ORF Transcript_1331/g.2901 Transcript_1331/m.2901 type:complete len:245 (+) Transcript_1331:274-1008(+)
MSSGPPRSNEREEKRSQQRGSGGGASSLVGGTVRFASLPRGINGCEHRGWQRVGILEGLEVRVQLLLAARPDDDRVAVLQLRVMPEPPKRGRHHAGFRSVASLLNALRCVKERFLPEPVLVHLVVVESTSRRIFVPLILARQDAASERVVAVEGHAKFPQTRQKLPFHLSRHSVVHPLIHSWSDVVVLLADLVDVADFPRLKVGQPKSLDLSFLVQLIHRCKRVIDACPSVGSMQVEKVDGVSL